MDLSKKHEVVIKMVKEGGTSAKQTTLSGMHMEANILGDAGPSVQAMYENFFFFWCVRENFCPLVCVRENFAHILCTRNFLSFGVYTRNFFLSFGVCTRKKFCPLVCTRIFFFVLWRVYEKTFVLWCTYEKNLSGVCMRKILSFGVCKRMKPWSPEQCLRKVRKERGEEPNVSHYEEKPSEKKIFIFVAEYKRVANFV